MSDQRPRIAINPRSGPVDQATEQNATSNTDAFTADLRIRGIDVTEVTRRPDAAYGDGRYAFTLATTGGEREIQMPGLPLDQVRWLKSAGQDIWDFPRLYVDDSSWVWFFALDQFDDGPRRWPDGTVTGGELIQFNTIKLAEDEEPTT